MTLRKVGANTTRIVGTTAHLHLTQVDLCVQVAICQMATLHQRVTRFIASLCLNPSSQLQKHMHIHAHVWSHCKFLVVLPIAHNHGKSTKPKIKMITESLRQNVRHVKQLEMFLMYIYKDPIKARVYKFFFLPKIKKFICDL